MFIQRSVLFGLLIQFNPQTRISFLPKFNFRFENWRHNFRVYFIFWNVFGIFFWKLIPIFFVLFDHTVDFNLKPIVLIFPLVRIQKLVWLPEGNCLTDFTAGNPSGVHFDNFRIS